MSTLTGWLIVGCGFRIADCGLRNGGLQIGRLTDLLTGPARIHINIRMRWSTLVDCSPSHSHGLRVLSTHVDGKKQVQRQGSADNHDRH